MKNQMKPKQQKKPEEKKKISFSYNLKEYLGYLFNYKLILGLTLFSVLLLEARHVLESFLFKYIIDKGTAFSAYTLTLSDFVNLLFIVALIFLIGYVILGSFLRWIFIHLLNVLESSLILDLKTKYFNHLISLDHSFHVSHKTGSLISRFGRGARAIERMTDVIGFSLAPLVFQLIVLVGSLIYLDKTSAVVISITVFIYICFGLFVQKLQQKANIEENKAEDNEKANVADFFTNIDSIKYFGKESLIKAKFKQLAETTKQVTVNHWNYYRWFDAGNSLILSLGTFFLVYFPLKQFLEGQTTLGTLAFIYTAYAGLFNPLYSFMYGIRDMYRAMADFEDLFEYGKITTKIADLPGSKNIKVTAGSVEFRDVLFKYGNRTVFENFSLSIPSGKKVALVGPSGSGKTTLIKLLYRFYDVDSGAILVDRQDIKSVRQESVRAEMAIVPQECILFDDTIYNNVAFSKRGATREQVMNAIKLAHMDKIIERLPQKENTLVGERGVRLSGGEKQRVSIARAILADKKILVLDEATSSLDSETEHEIQKDLKELMKGRTSIIIAHRLSTIMEADEIVVLKNGDIVQKGTHKELIRREGEYKKLWNLQKGGYIA
jgi:ABC-type multidrug transport system fused ATPase/permease subunit